MSIQLPNIDLSKAVVGTGGTITLPVTGLLTVPQDTNNPQYSNLRLFNESGCGIALVYSDGTNEFVPAGAWPIYPVGPTITEVAWSVVYVIPNAPIAQLLSIYYYPGEQIPQNVVLGNSPIGITGSVQTSGTTLSNEGNAAGTLVIDIGDIAIAKLIQFFTDHFILEVDQSGTAHTVLKGNASGNPLQIGQAGDISEVLGKLTVDQLLTAAAAITISAGGINVTGGSTVDSSTVTGNETVGGTFGSTGAATLSSTLTVSGNTLLQNITSILSILFNSASTPVNLLGLVAAGDVLNAVRTGTGVWDIHIQSLGNTSNIFFHTPGASTGDIFIDDIGKANFPNGIVLATGGIKEESGATNTACGAGTTITHGLTNTPSRLIATPNIAQAGSATVGIGSIGATTFKATVGAGSAISWKAER